MRWPWKRDVMFKPRSAYTFYPAWISLKHNCWLHISALTSVFLPLSALSKYPLEPCPSLSPAFPHLSECAPVLYLPFLSIVLGSIWASTSAVSLSSLPLFNPTPIVCHPYPCLTVFDCSPLPRPPLSLVETQEVVSGDLRKQKNVGFIYPQKRSTRQTLCCGDQR